MVWTRRRLTTAAAGTLGAALLLGLPTDLVPNPVFGRMVPVPVWAWVAWAVTAVLSGLLLATYVREGDVPVRTEDRRGAVGGLLAYLAVGCPVCNKLVVLALGASGAMTWFAPAQPVLAVGAAVLLALALRRRLTAARACPVPAAVRDAREQDAEAQGAEQVRAGAAHGGETR